MRTKFNTIPFYFLFFGVVLSISSSHILNTHHANTTRLCRHRCILTHRFLSSQAAFNLSANCGNVASFYGCQVIMKINYTDRTLEVTFHGHTENSIEIYNVDYDYAIDQAPEVAFYRNISINIVTFTCLTDDLCTDTYASLVAQRLIDNGPILYELVPLFLERSVENRTILCLNGSNHEIECYGGYCESRTQESVTTWSYHDCVYPSELSALSTVELTSFTGHYMKYEPENPANDQINDEKITLLCNVDLCNSMETRRKGGMIMHRYNRAAFYYPFHSYDTTESTIVPTTEEKTSEYSQTVTTSTLPTISSSTHPCTYVTRVLVLLMIVLCTY